MHETCTFSHNTFFTANALAYETETSVVLTVLGKSVPLDQTNCTPIDVTMARQCRCVMWRQTARANIELRIQFVQKRNTHFSQRINVVENYLQTAEIYLL